MSLEEFRKAYKMWVDIADFCHECKEENFRRDCNKCPVQGRYLYWLEKWVYMMGPLIEKYGKKRILDEMEKLKETKADMKVIQKMKKLRDKVLHIIEGR